VVERAVLHHEDDDVFKILNSGKRSVERCHGSSVINPMRRVRARLLILRCGVQLEPRVVLKA
jgi:hypothetical protein